MYMYGHMEAYFAYFALEFEFEFEFELRLRIRTHGSRPLGISLITDKQYDDSVAFSSDATSLRTLPIHV